MRGRVLLPTIRIKCTPPTARKGIIRKKLELVDAIKKEIHDINKLKDSCKNEQLYLEVHFRLLKTTEDGRSKKDLDNMLKVLCDILPERIVARGTHSDGKELGGLGLIGKDQDDLIMGMLCTKEIVHDVNDEGIDLAIYEWRQNA